MSRGLGDVYKRQKYRSETEDFDHLIDKKEAINRLRYEKPNMQICFRTEDALKKLHFRHALHE